MKDWMDNSLNMWNFCPNGTVDVHHFYMHLKWEPVSLACLFAWKTSAQVELARQYHTMWSNNECQHLINIMTLSGEWTNIDDLNAHLVVN